METIDLSEALASLTTKDNLANYIGSDGKQTPQKAAEVLGGLIGINDTWIREKPKPVSLNITKNGIYTIMPEVVTDMGSYPTGAYKYGVLIVMTTTRGGLQIYAPDNMGNLYIRSIYNSLIAGWSEVIATKVSL